MRALAKISKVRIFMVPMMPKICFVILKMKWALRWWISKIWSMSKNAPNMNKKMPLQIKMR